MLDRNNPKPLYQQLRDVLVDAIDSGRWGRMIRFLLKMSLVSLTV